MSTGVVVDVLFDETFTHPCGTEETIVTGVGFLGFHIIMMLLLFNSLRIDPIRPIMTRLRSGLFTFIVIRRLHFSRLPESGLTAKTVFLVDHLIRHMHDLCLLRYSLSSRRGSSQEGRVTQTTEVRVLMVPAIPPVEIEIIHVFLPIEGTLGCSIGRLIHESHSTWSEGGQLLLLLLGGGFRAQLDFHDLLECWVFVVDT